MIMDTGKKLKIGDVSDNGQVMIVDEDRLCYLVKSDSRGAVGLRTISKNLLDEYITYFTEHPNANANLARDVLSGKSDIDKFEYGYTSTLTVMAKMAIEGARNISVNAGNVHNKNKFLQQIYYGAPGTGKSHEIKKLTKGKEVIRTTFHPDSDYSTFVGTYKPTTKSVPIYSTYGEKAVEVKDADGNPMTEDRIVYEFVEQAFLQAYIKAWKQFAKANEGNAAEEVYLIIEEINRGNCAQIFGDLFQLLDRGEDGFSEYPIVADKDLQKQLAKAFADMPFLNAPSVCGMSAEEVAVKIRKGEILLLPNNLYIWATMNTSDQSLFPIDSAFKRRWDWQYMPISDAQKGWQIEANGKRYDWWQFLQKMNDKIGSTTNSEDKKLGYFFCKAKNGVIDADTFVGKVVFYIWNDVFKDFAEEAGDLFKDSSDPQNPLLSFNKFYTIGMDGKAKVVDETVERLFQNLGMEPFINGEDDEDENNGRVKYIIDGEIFKRKSYAGKEIMSRYLKEHPNLTFKEIKETFPDSMLVHSDHRGLIASTDTPLDSYGRYYSPEQFTSSDGVTFKIYKQWTSVSINNIINFAKNQGLDIKVEESDGQGE